MTTAVATPRQSEKRPLTWYSGVDSFFKIPKTVNLNTKSTGVIVGRANNAALNSPRVNVMSDDTTSDSGIILVDSSSSEDEETNQDNEPDDLL